MDEDEVDNNEKNVKLKDIEEKIKNELAQKQKMDFEKDLQDLQDHKSKKGRTAAVFRLKSKIIGNKKESPEASSIKDPFTNELLFNKVDIKKASVDYVVDLLKNNEPRDEFKHEK